VNGWTYSLKTGLYGTDYLQRAFVTAIGLGANRPDDAVYPETRVDSSGRRLSGAHSYTIRFPKGQTPPVNAFWSLTMYDAALFFTPNPLHRHTLSPRDPLKYNPDGSLDLLISHAPPAADRRSNWLPAPEGNFVLMLRMYWPKPPVVDGTWSPPPVERLP
jgi:DNA sulfur modification protein DndE